jgi:hypothetical protein
MLARFWLEGRRRRFVFLRMGGVIVGNAKGDTEIINPKGKVGDTGGAITEKPSAPEEEDNEKNVYNEE